MAIKCVQLHSPQVNRQTGWAVTGTVPGLADDPDQVSMRIAPRTMLCATDWQARESQESQGRFAELRFQLASNASRLPSTILTRSPCLNTGLAPDVIDCFDPSSSRTETTQ